MYKELKGAGIRVKLDDRDNYNPGWKYNYWEQRGVPLRIEIGPMDLANKSVMVARRDNGKKASLPMAGLAGALNTLMDTVQGDMLAKARKQRDSQVDVITKYGTLVVNETVVQGSGLTCAWRDGGVVQVGGLCSLHEPEEHLPAALV